MKITLQVNGQEMAFSEEELSTILSDYFSKKSKRPVEGEWFEVNPRNIDRKLFVEPKLNKNQEDLRLIILEAFREVDANSKYNKTFKTMFPDKLWKSYKTIEEYEKIASELGGHMADWVEQALEWAQRIANGEEWEIICNETDDASWCRLIKWKRNETKLIGGASKSKFRWMYPPCHISSYNYSEFIEFGEVVPLIVAY